jgi:hypothetical protein
MSPSMLGLLEVLDRDGQARQSLAVMQWPVSIGRALDNDLVLSDPHIAAHHGTIDSVDGQLTLAVGDTRNGLLLGRKRLAAGERATLATEGESADIALGRTHLRLRLPGHALAPELATAPDGPVARRLGPIAIAAVLLVFGTLFTTWLGTDPDGDTRAMGTALLSLVAGGAVWCTVWALLTKTFTRQARFGWHVKVFLFASVALMAISAVVPLLAYMFSWPWLSDFEYVGVIAVLAGALYFHLLAVEPARHRVLKWAAVTCALVGVLLTMWFNLQRNDQLGDELYMSHLYPPGLRVARPIATDAFVNGLTSLKPKLDSKAKEPGFGDEGPQSDDE